MTKREKDLKEIYDELPIAKVEKTAISCQTSAKNIRKKFIEVLYYLQFTSRYKENKKYKNATFESYIYDQYHLRITSFDKEKIAFLLYPKQAVNLGPGIITKVRAKCGVLKTPKVLKEIQASQQTPAKIEKIIEKYAKPVKPTPVKPSISHIEKALDRSQEDTRQIVKRASDYLRQIDKLKNTVKNKNIEIADLKAQVASYKKRYEDIKSAANTFYNYMDDKTAAETVAQA